MTTHPRIACRLQFRLLTLFILIAAIAVPLGIRASRERRYREQLAALVVLDDKGDAVGFGRVDNPIFTYSFECEDYVGADDLKRGIAVTYVRTGPTISDGEASAILSFPTVQCLDFGGYVGGPRPIGPIDAALAKLSTLPSVEWLCLERSGVTDEGVSHLGGLRSLRVLRLEGAKISGTTFGRLSSLRKLELLDLSATGFTDEGARHLAPLTSLRVLSLGGTNVTDSALQPIATLPHLQSLSLYATDVGDDGVRHLASLNSLESLFLGGTRITGAGLASLSNLNELRFLFLDGDDVGDESLAALARLPKLENLVLAGTRVSDEGLKTLAQFENLESVDIHGCAISDAGLVHLRRMRSLRKLNVEGTSVTARGVAELKRLKLKPSPLTGQKLVIARNYGGGPQDFDVYWSEPAENQSGKTNAE